MFRDSTFIESKFQLEIQINEVAESKAETERIERKLEAEKERHKTMVLFLINERKQMLLKMHELRVKSESHAFRFGFVATAVVYDLGELDKQQLD
ncbi:unnamed protein product [Strongylus vulgaris]|uniref:Uncharacterized protein n=1 Tax=Strongylus vulgaris TaxID=40348 RepID=A0A3P7IFR9_STRVU|nr:unnamed protein product [Strongylus vulgaris]